MHIPFPIGATLFLSPGCAISVGIYTGGLGITVSHELVHRTNRVEQWLGEGDTDPVSLRVGTRMRDLSARLLYIV